jgi:ribosomal protein S18 acetylase RimI-like enzyme
MKIKAITRDEIDSIKELWKELNVHHLSRSAHFKDLFSKLTFEKRMEGLKERDHFVAYVAESKSEKVGYCVATVAGLVGEIDSLFVKGSYRGKGAGEKLMSLALKWLRGHRCETLKVSIAEGNEKAIGFYKRFGFAERFIVMEMHNHPLNGVGGKRRPPPG